jgi:CheY-like chemotaxis protein
MIEALGEAPQSREQLASIAHEYNNVLTVMGGSVALADRHAVGNPALIRLLDHLRMAIDRAAALTERLAALGACDVRPAAADPPAQPVPPPAAAPAARVPCVLVVEDDANVAALAVTALEDQGLRVVWASSAVEALERLTTIGRVDAVFSDIVMPGGLSGIDLAKRLEVSHPGTPVLLATGFSREALGTDAMRFPVLPKPYSVADLGRRVLQLLAAKT